MQRFDPADGDIVNMVCRTLRCQHAMHVGNLELITIYGVALQMRIAVIHESFHTGNDIASPARSLSGIFSVAEYATFKPMLDFARD